MRLDVALVHRGGGKFPFDDHIGLAEALLHIALLIAEMGRDVAGLVRNLAHRRGPQVLVDQRRTLRHSLAHINHRVQYLVVHLDQRHGGLRYMPVDRGHGRHRMPLEQRLIAGHHVVRRKLEPAVIAAQFLPAQGGEGQVLRRDDRPHTGQGICLAGIDRPDSRVRVRAAQHLPVQQPGKLHIGPVLGSTGDLVHPVGSYRAFPHDVVFDFR